MADLIRIRRGTAAQWSTANPVLRRNELGVESDTGKSKTGDGVAVYASLPYDIDLPGPGVDPGDGVPAWRAMALTAPVTGSTPGAGTVGTPQIADGAVTPAKMAHAGPASFFIPGAYYTSQGSRGTYAIAAGTMSCTPFWVGVNTSFNRIGAEVTVAATGSTVRLGIYADNGNSMPGSLTLDAGTIDASTIGAKEITLGSPVALTAGLWWLAAVPQGGVPTVRCIAGTGFLPVGAGSLASSTSGGPMTGAYQASVNAALPATFTLTDRVSAAILVALRAV